MEIKRRVDMLNILVIYNKFYHSNNHQVESCQNWGHVENGRIRSERIALKPTNQSLTH